MKRTESRSSLCDLWPGKNKHSGKRENVSFAFAAISLVVRAEQNCMTHCPYNNTSSDMSCKTAIPTTTKLKLALLYHTTVSLCPISVQMATVRLVKFISKTDLSSWDLLQPRRIHREIHRISPNNGCWKIFWSQTNQSNLRKKCKG